MYSDEKKRLQINFSKIHQILFVFVFIYLLERFSVNPIQFKLSSLLLIAPIFFIDMFFLIFGLLRSYKATLFLRYFEICIATYFLVYTTFSYAAIIIVLFYILFIVEYFVLIDFMDDYFRIKSIAIITIPIISFIVLRAILHIEFRQDIFIYCFSFTILSFILITLSRYLIEWTNNINQLLFAQSRLINNANNINESLLINQEKVKKANELLGYQKIQLKAAYNKINSVNAEMIIQNQIIKYISSSLDIGELMNLITESILNKMGVDICVISLHSYNINNKDEKSTYKINARLSNCQVEHLSQYIQDGCFLKYMENKTPYVDNRVAGKSYPFIGEINIGSFIISPLVKDDEILGVLFVGHSKYDFFLDNSSFFEGIVSQILIALNNANLYSKMEYMATRDGLTGIYNRHNLTKMFNYYLNDAIMNKYSLTLALLDIDNFKNVNDTYGHLFGDTVIKSVACITENIAKKYNGFAGRYGGEEFVVVFPNKSVKDSYPVIEKIHQRIKEEELIYDSQSVYVKVSVGITSFPETCSNPNELLNRADWAMYYSKENGKDRITVDSDDIRETRINFR